MFIILFILFYVLVFLAWYWLDITIQLSYPDLYFLYEIFISVLIIFLFRITWQKVVQWFNKGSEINELYKYLIDKQTEEADKIAIMLRNMYKTYKVIFGFVLIIWILSIILFYSINDLIYKYIFLSLYFAICLSMFLTYELTIDIAKYKIERKEI